MAMADVDQTYAEAAFAEAKRRIEKARTDGRTALDCSGLGQFHHLWLCPEHAKPHLAEWASA
jgi:hypothetical protein